MVSILTMGATVSTVEESYGQYHRDRRYYQNNDRYDDGSYYKVKKPMGRRTKGALIGGGAGAVAGGLLGHGLGGAAVGAGVGAGAGYLIGRHRDKRNGPRPYVIKRKYRD